MRNLFSYLLAVASFLLMIYFYYDVQNLGFPDGHLTEYDKMLQGMYPVYMAICLVFTLSFFYLARKKESKSLNKWSKIAFILFGLFILTILLLYYYFGIHLDHGRGG